MKSVMAAITTAVCLFFGASSQAGDKPAAADNGLQRISAARQEAVARAHISHPDHRRDLGRKALLRIDVSGKESADRAALSSPVSRLDSATAGSVAGATCNQPGANCQLPDLSFAQSSDGAGFRVADDFRPAADGGISEVCFRGGYFDFTLDPPAECAGTVIGSNSFTISYYRDNGALPGEMIGSFRQAGGDLLVGSGNWTGQSIAGQIREYEFVALQRDPVPVLAGECYWIEITNDLTVNLPDSTCSWLWEGGVGGNGWSLQDDDGDGYDIPDAWPEDLSFCVNVPLDDSAPCFPTPPPNDDCENAQTIFGRGEFPFDNITATTDGPTHADCQAFGEDQIEADVWYRWTAPCDDMVVVSTCDISTTDTRIAVYEGWACPPTDANILACNDDRCGTPAPRQSMVAFPATAGQAYLIRLGVWPGARRGADKFRILCGPPENAACPGDGACCDEAGTGTPACDDETCCELVCACDSFCCDGLWDEDCATGLGERGGTPGCGAQMLCTETCTPCISSTVDCCVGVPLGTGEPGCSDPTCCEAVCTADSFCCEVEWDVNCATDGFNHNGNGAAVLCPDLCGTPSCPPGTVEFIDPPAGVIDARQPYPPLDPASPQGITALKVSGPSGVASASCWAVCESPGGGETNTVSGVTDNGDGTHTIHLARPISVGAATTLTYQADDGSFTRGVFVFHPGDVNGDGVTDVADVPKLIERVGGIAGAPPGVFAEDIDHSGALNPGDVLRLIDLFNGAGDYDPWINTPAPLCGSCCPQ